MASAPTISSPLQISRLNFRPRSEHDPLPPPSPSSSAPLSSSLPAPSSVPMTSSMPTRPLSIQQSRVRHTEPPRPLTDEPTDFRLPVPRTPSQSATPPKGSDLLLKRSMSFSRTYSIPANMSAPTPATPATAAAAAAPMVYPHHSLHPTDTRTAESPASLGSDDGITGSSPRSFDAKERWIAPDSPSVGATGHAQSHAWVNPARMSSLPEARPDQPIEPVRSYSVHSRYSQMSTISTTAGTPCSLASSPDSHPAVSSPSSPHWNSQRDLVSPSLTPSPRPMSHLSRSLSVGGSASNGMLALQIPVAPSRTVRAGSRSNAVGVDVAPPRFSRPQDPSSPLTPHSMPLLPVQISAPPVSPASRDTPRSSFIQHAPTTPHPPSMKPSASLPATAYGSPQAAPVAFPEMEKRTPSGFRKFFKSFMEQVQLLDDQDDPFAPPGPNSPAPAPSSPDAKPILRRPRTLSTGSTTGNGANIIPPMPSPMLMPLKPVKDAEKAARFELLLQRIENDPEEKVEPIKLTLTTEYSLILQKDYDAVELPGITAPSA
ncbi:uncharacterized protein BJ171DRAFT_584086 [Polychytrium aggregatum]|uniref:uncharacterized protein n=1 Tax=Polychytrium aggregatum TaxID=110093 RepID=UPI0022FE4B8D|nr:uncharacterized protein BJ171DRAFT_584086 [Polychytrium aggregatum]KAI9202446.1 hypothetical protein BJ171DRAFT_584086 [Polychytrium aggregatum]